MNFSERLRGAFKRDMGTSKDLLHKAGNKVEDLSIKGMLKIESAQLETYVDKLVARLGKEVYASFVDMDHPSVNRDAPLISEILDELRVLHLRIESKEKEYRSIGKSAEA